jgi:hypothetical protein
VPKVFSALIHVGNRTHAWMNISYNVTNITGGGISYRHTAFFEWTLKQSLFVHFDDKSYLDYPVQITKYIWNFGDGSGGTGANPIHQYSMPGTYNVTMVVFFTDGNVFEYSTQVEVVDNAITWWQYAMIGLLVFIGILFIGWWAIRAQSKKLARAMFLLLCIFIGITVITLQMFVI